MVTIEVRGKTASVEGLVWISDDPRVANVLNSLFTYTISVDPNPDLTLANLALERLRGGRVISADEPPKSIRGRVY